MLRFLSIRRLAVIDSVDMEFDPGLNVLTGETGAGKSILVGAVGLLLGGRASGDLVRTGEDTATVEALFDRNGEETAVRRAAPYLLAKYAAYLSWGIPGIILDSSTAPDVQLRRLAKNRFAVGSPAQVTEALLAQHRAGVTHVTMRVSWPGMPQDDILAGLELLGRAVLPEVRRRTSS